MMERCYKPNIKGFDRYGGRGIRVCDRWHHYEAFVADMGQPPPERSIDRIDNDGDYEPSNCRWATMTQQTNNRGVNVRLTHDGRTQTVTEWRRDLGFGRGVIPGRLGRGWSVERALTEPAAERRQLPFNVTKRAEQIGVPEWTLRRRMKRGMTPEQVAQEFRAADSV